MRPVPQAHGPRLAIALVVLAAVGSATMPADATQLRPELQPSLVQCVPLRLPVRASSDSHARVHSIGGGRFFAPTRQAMFFAHAGDRCAWHAKGPIRS